MIGIAPAGRWIALILLTAPLLEGEEVKLLPASPSEAAGSSRERLVSPQIAGMLAASMPKYQPPKPAPEAAVEAETEAEANHPVILMAPVKVVESKVEDKNRSLLEKIREEKEKVTTEAFTLKDGGTFVRVGAVEFKLKYDSKHKGFDLLNIKF